MDIVLQISRSQFAWQYAQLKESSIRRETGSGLTAELPVHVVLVPPGATDSAPTSTSGCGTGGAMSTESPLLFLGLPSEVSSSPAVVVTKKLWIFLVAATALLSRRLAARTPRVLCYVGQL